MQVVRRVEGAAERGLVLAVEPVLLQAHEVAALALDGADQRLRAREERPAVGALDAAAVAEVARRQQVERHERQRTRAPRKPLRQRPRSHVCVCV